MLCFMDLHMDCHTIRKPEYDREDSWEGYKSTLHNFLQFCHITSSLCYYFLSIQNIRIQPRLMHSYRQSQSWDQQKEDEESRRRKD